MGHSLTIIGTAIASQTLMGIILPQTSLKHKNHNELNTKQYNIKNKHANTCMHENFSQAKKTNRF
ncbi:hypothetical protein [Helicobacter pylori]|uniref:hypothetical protein n=1 Tax=Helicobacter pylori TaxID=210 RepID=UPI002711FFF9|nr:hypothetical protein [Helicobacter pylori]MDO7825816.1 hypothetical protein [Helicobacter pylori]